MLNPLTYPIRLPWLTLRGPLRPRPISGLVTGAILGWLIALLDRSAPNIDFHESLVRSVLAGVIAGTLIGALQPLFRTRVGAGLVVAVSAAIAFRVAMPVFDREWNAAGALFMGICHGIVYGALLWSYEPPAPPSDAAIEEQVHGLK
jgi:hypothetical protein